MRLSEIDWGDLGYVYRDGSFDYFGLLNYHPDGRMLSFWARKEFKEHLMNDCITCIVCKPQFVELLPENINGVVVSDNPLYAFWRVHDKYGCVLEEKENAVGKNTMIGSRAVLAPSNVVIGDNVLIEDYALIKEGSIIGNNVIIRSGSIIGGVANILSSAGKEIRTSRLYGRCVIEDNVEINYNNTIVRGTFEWMETRIKKGVRIDSNNFISHNVTIGENSVVTASTVINGDVRIGANSWISPGAVITNSVTIGENVSLMLGSLVRKSVDDDMVVVGERLFNRRIYEATQRIQRK